MISIDHLMNLAIAGTILACQAGALILSATVAVTAGGVSLWAGASLVRHLQEILA